MLDMCCHVGPWVYALSAILSPCWAGSGPITNLSWCCLKATRNWKHCQHTRARQTRTYTGNCCSCQAVPPRIYSNYWGYVGKRGQHNDNTHGKRCSAVKEMLQKHEGALRERDSSGAAAGGRGRRQSLPGEIKRGRKDTALLLLHRYE